ncbi:hypothetical protein GCM10022226_64500 [Sphaerisporangium flaviroseum]|uniref:Lipoprotein n=1 Tax=Sphaerisporangium flaviroseum TaxID=509199 RepID=A0ABP7J5E6_9ACTN
MAVALLALAAGCGQSAASSDGVASVKRTQSTPQASATPTASVDPEEQGRKFAQCMRDNGVDMPDPEPDGNGRVRMRIGEKNADDTKLDKAMKACRALSPFGQKGREITPEQQEKARAFSQCMRDNGIDMPDPDFSGGGVGIKIGGPDGKIKPDDPKFKKAMEACRDKLGGPVGAPK